MKKFSKIPLDRVVVLNKSGAKRLKDFERMEEMYPSGFIAVTNYEAMRTEAFHRMLVEWRPEILVADESQKCKTPNSKTAKALYPLADSSKHRYILTGTPVTNKLLDIWSQFRVLDKGETFSDNFFVFRSKYFYDANAGKPWLQFKNWVPQKSAEEEISKRMSKYALQARKEDCLSLPPMVKQSIPVELGKDQRKAYDEMEKHFVTEVGGSQITAQLVLTQTLRLQTILAGFVSSEDTEEGIVFKDNPRLKALSELMESLHTSGQVLVWTNFTATYKMIGDELTKLKIPHGFLTGQQNVKEKEECIRAFKQGEISTLVCNPQAVSLGVNLQEAKYMVYYTRSYNMEQDVQSEARCYRGGSEMHDKVTRYDLVAADTLDDVILEALRGKQALAEKVLEWVKK